MSDDFFQGLRELFDKGNDYLTASTRDRPYDGQPQTDVGERGKQDVYGVTIRDVRDSFVIGAFEAAGFAFDHTDDYTPIYTGTIYDLPWEEMDPSAVLSNAMCELERRMGIYPNVPKLIGVEDVEEKIDEDEGEGDEKEGRKGRKGGTT
jgi:hypothetical protein